MKKIIIIVTLTILTFAKGYSQLDFIGEKLTDLLGRGTATAEYVAKYGAQTMLVLSLINEIDQLACMTAEVNIYLKINVQKNGCKIHLLQGSVQTNLQHIVILATSYYASITDIGKSKETGAESSMAILWKMHDMVIQTKALLTALNGQAKERALKHVGSYQMQTKSRRFGVITQ